MIYLVSETGCFKELELHMEVQVQFKAESDYCHGCGIYGKLIFVERKALNQTHSKLCNGFSNTAIGKDSVVRIRIRDRTKYFPVF